MLYVNKGSICKLKLTGQLFFINQIFYMLKTSLIKSPYCICLFFYILVLGSCQQKQEHAYLLGIVEETREIVDEYYEKGIEEGGSIYEEEEGKLYVKAKESQCFREIRASTKASELSFINEVKEKTLRLHNGEITRKRYLEDILEMRLGYLKSRENRIINFLKEPVDESKLEPFYPTHKSFFEFIMKGNLTDCKACMTYYHHIRMAEINKFQLLNRLILECYNLGCDISHSTENMKLLKLLACSAQIHPILLGSKNNLGHPDEACDPYKQLYHIICNPNEDQEIENARKILLFYEYKRWIGAQNTCIVDKQGEVWQHKLKASHNLFLAKLMCKSLYNTLAKDSKYAKALKKALDIDPTDTKYYDEYMQEYNIAFRACIDATLKNYEVGMGDRPTTLKFLTLNEREKQILEPLLSHLRINSTHQEVGSKRAFKIKERSDKKKKQRQVKRSINAPKQVASKEVYKTTAKKDHMDETEELIHEELIKLNEGDVLEADWNHILDAQHEYLDSESEEEEDDDEVIEENIAQELEEPSQPSISFKDWPLDKKSRYLHPSSFTQIEYEEVKLKRHQKKVDALFDPERHITITWQTFVLLWHHIGGKIIGEKNGGSHRKIIGPNSEFLGSICIPHAKQHFKSNIPHLQTLALYVGLRPTN